MYLAVCEDNKNDLDCVCSLLDAWQAEHGSAVRRKVFRSAAEIVFLSSSPGFAYESYGVRALNYLLKPAQREKLFALLDRLYLQEQINSDALTLKTTSAAIVRVAFSQISYVEVIRKHVYFHLADGTEREVAGTLKDFEAVLLSRPEFMHVHRSYIANILQVEELSSTGLRTLRGETLPVSRTLRKEAAGRWLDYHLEGGR